MTRKLELPDHPFELTLTGLSSHAEGIGRYENKVIFVEGGLPGEKVEVQIFHKSRKMARAKVLRVIEPSPDRLEPPCPYYRECGGCQLQHLTHTKQLYYKRQTVQDALHHVGSLDLESNPVIGDDHDYGYRNKMTFPLVVQRDQIRVALHKRNSFKDIIPLQDCLIIENPMREALAKGIAILNQYYTANDVYNYHSPDGNLRYFGIRSIAGKLVFILVLRQYDQAKAIRLATDWLDQCGIASVAFYESEDVNDYDWGLKPPKLVLGDNRFLVPFRDITGTAQPLTFLQTNTPMTTTLYEYALSLPVQDKSVLFDGYCGIGLFSLALAKEFEFVIGVEIDPLAIQSAKESAARQNITNCHFMAGPVEHVLRIFGNPLVTNPKPLRPEVTHLADEALRKLGKRKITTVILDPPRAGCHPKVIKRLGEIQPLDIILISCHPATLARDLSGLVSLGYHPLSVQPFDLFPQTFHVETVVHLRR